MSSGERCRECGTAIPADGPGGFCAQCLLGLGLHQTQGAERSPQDVGGEQTEASEGKGEQKEEATALGQSAAPSNEKPGDWIGRYRLIEEIGHGGCGVVYMAEQEEPVRRRVALKVIKLGMDTKQVVARFEAERQALAVMDHPNIAKVLEAGASEAGRPYFVMELVGGIKITDYCDQNRLTTRQRLDLFIEVCRAIQHAHQKGIIHRDIKPSNVLVAMQDGRPVPKVIDFGIAKATQGRLTDQTVFTAFEQFIGTPAYMSPEQAQFGGLDVDTRSDIYSLGVLLYEMLTGKTPFDSKELLAAGLDAMRRTIQEKEPLTPSTRLKQELARSARSDNSALRTPHSALDRDLDWIVMKCLDKDRARRYETANGLARDIERHLSNEPVVAGPPSRLYRFQKAVRRNKTAFAAAGVIAIVLLTGVLVSTWEAVRATHAKTRADEEAAKQETINRFLNDMLASADPWTASSTDQTRGRNVTVVEVLDKAARQLDFGKLKERPELEAVIRQTLGRTYSGLGQTELANPHLQRALELSRHVYGAHSENVSECLLDLSRLRGQQGRIVESENLAKDALAIERELHGMEHLHIAAILKMLGENLDERFRGGELVKNMADAENAYREALRIQRKLLKSETPDLAATMTGLARFVSSGVEREQLLREAIRIQKTLLGPQHPDVATSMYHLAFGLTQKGGAHAEAEDLYNQAIAIQRVALGPKHFGLSTSLDGLGCELLEQQKPVEAEAAFREALAIRREAIPNGLDVAWTLGKLATTLRAQKRLEEARRLHQEKLHIELRQRGPSNWARAAASLEELVSLASETGNYREVESALREGIALLEQTHPDSWITFLAKSMLGSVLAAEQTFADGELSLLAGYEGLKEREAGIPNAENWRVREALKRLIQLYAAWQKPDQLAKWQAEMDWRQGLNDECAIKHWLLLAPIPFKGQDGAKALDEEQLAGEPMLQPRPGDSLLVAGSGLVWLEYRTTNGYAIDFNAFLGTNITFSVAYAVAYVMADRPQKDLLLKIGSDDQSRVFFNGRQRYECRKGRRLAVDEDIVSGVELQAGLNVVVFKVVNMRGRWGGSLRFADKDGKPIQGFKVTLNPDQGTRPEAMTRK